MKTNLLADTPPVVRAFLRNFFLDRAAWPDDFPASGGNINDQYEIMAFAAQPRTRALGALSGVGNMTAEQALSGVWPADNVSGTLNTTSPYNEHPWHDAEFLFDASSQDGYWNKLLEEYGLPRNH